MEKFGLKKILGNSIWQIAEKIITMIISVIVTGMMARYLGAEEYGIVNYVISVVALFTAFSTLGMDQITIKDLIDNPNKKDSILGTSFIIRIIGSLILIFISQITLYVCGKANALYQILGIIYSSSMIFKAFEVIEYYLQSKMKLKVTSIIRFITAILVAVIKLLVIKFDFGMIGLTLSYLFDSVIAAILFFIYFKIKNNEKMKVEKKYAKELLSKCWYIAVSSLLTTLYMRIDQVMLGSMLVDKTENGIYAAAVKIAEMWYFIPLALITSFQPVIVAKKNAKEEEDYMKFMQKLYDVVAIIGIICGIGITLFGRIAVNILYGAEYIASYKVLIISVWAGLFATINCARMIWLISENLQKYTICYTSIGVILNIVLNIVLIPQIGAIGAAIATLISQVVTNVFVLMLFKKTRISSIMILKALFKNQVLKESIKKLMSRMKK